MCRQPLCFLEQLAIGDVLIVEKYSGLVHFIGILACCDDRFRNGFIICIIHADFRFASDTHGRANLDKLTSVDQWLAFFRVKRLYIPRLSLSRAYLPPTTHMFSRPGRSRLPMGIRLYSYVRVNDLSLNCPFIFSFCLFFCRDTFIPTFLYR